MPVLKRLLITIPAIVVVLLISAAIAYQLIDDKVIEDRALQALQNTFKRDVTVDGNFTLSRSLHPTLQISGVRIASADWDQGTYLLEAEKLEVGIALLHLLLGIISVENVVFNDAVINLKRNKDGQSNLEFSKAEQPTKETITPARLDIIDIQIKNLHINYSDEQNNSAFVYALDSFNLHPKSRETIQLSVVSRLNEQALEISSEMCRIRHLLAGNDCNLSAEINATPFTSNISGSVDISDRGNLNMHIAIGAGNITEFKLTEAIPLPTTESLDISFLLSGPFNRLKISGLEAQVELQDSKATVQGSIDSVNALSGLNISLAVSGSHPEWLNQYQQAFPADLVDQFNLLATVESDGETWRLHSIDSTIEIDKSKITSKGELSISTDSTQIAIDIDAQGKHPKWLNEVQQVIVAEYIDEFSIQASIKSLENTISIEDLAARIIIEDNTTLAQGNIKFPVEQKSLINLAIQSSGKNLKSLEKLINQSMPKSSKFSAKVGLVFQGSTLSLAKLQLEIDDTKLTGDSKVGFTSPPNIQAKLQGDSLNVEHILAVLQSNQQQPADKETNNEKNFKLFSEEPIELKWLNAANTDVSISIDNLIYKQAVLKDVQATAITKNSTIAIDINSLTYQGANLRANTKVNANKNTFKHSLHTEDFNLGLLLSEIGVSKNLQGKIDASIDLNSHGTTSQQVANNANGRFTTIMTEGFLADAPIDLLAGNLLVELMPGKSKKENTKIECLFVHFTGTDGVFESEATLLNTENIVMTTTGSIDLTTEKLNLLLIPKPKNIELFTLDANIRVTGSFTEPSFSLDKGSLLKKVLKSASTVALGPAALVIPFASMGNSKNEKCFSEVASTTAKAVEAQLEAERNALEEATIELLNP